jgi:hypothetical protein
MTTRVDSWNHGYQPADSVWRTADLTVLLLVVVALLGGVFLRQSNFNATTETSTNGVTFNIPRGAYSRTEGETYIATTPEGFSVRVQTLEIPPIGAEDAAALAATRAIQLAQGRDMFQSVGTEAVQVAERAGAVMEYQYVQNNNDQLFSNTLQVVNGYELLVAHEGRLYAISLEGPSDKRAELDALWSQIQSSVRFGG